QSDRHRPRRDPDSGKPLIRSLFWKLSRGARILGAECGVSAALSWEHLERTGRCALAIPHGYLAGECGLHTRHHARLDTAASKLEQWRDEWLRDFACRRQ